MSSVDSIGLGVTGRQGRLFPRRVVGTRHRNEVVERAAVFEEVMFRGFMIERLAEITGSRAVAGIVAAVVFTLAHLGSWGWIHIPIAACGALS